MYSIAVIGDRDSVYGFQALGLNVECIEHGEDALPKIKTICSGQYAIVYITEALAEQYEQELERYTELTVPSIIQIPGVTGNTGKGIANVKKSVEKAVGSDIIFNE